jgi:class 3 adenylate cyclase
VGIGIDLGVLMLSIVGEKNCLEGTVIGDVVNIAARMESMTNTYEQNILISHNVYQSLKRPERYHLHDLGEVNNKVNKMQ